MFKLLISIYFFIFLTSASLQDFDFKCTKEVHLAIRDSHEKFFISENSPFENFDYEWDNNIMVEEWRFRQSRIHIGFVVGLQSTIDNIIKEQCKKYYVFKTYEQTEGNR